MNKYKVIIADDENIERRVLSMKLDKFFPGELEVRQAENGRQVLEEFEQEPAQILILDIAMPGISGLEAAEQIRRKDKTCSIIFLTAFDEFDYAKRAISVGATDYLLKPCDDRELMDAVEEAERTNLLRAEEHNTRMRRQEQQVKPDAAQSQSLGQDQGEKRSLKQKGQEVNSLTNETSQKEAAETEAGRNASGSTEDKAENNATTVHSNESARTDVGVIRNKERMDALIRDNYSRDISVADVADELGYTEAYFCRLFKQYSGQSFVSYLTEFRIREAKRLLDETTDSIREIGRQVGYPDPNYFTRVFRKVTGITPSEYRQKK